MKKLPLKLKLYLGFIYIVTIISLCFFIKTKYRNIEIPNYEVLIFFSALMGVTESLSVIYKNMSFSTSFAITLTTYFMYGPVTAMLVATIGLSISVIKHEDRYIHIFNTPLYKSLFNYCMFILPIIYGDYIYVRLGGVYGDSDIGLHIPAIIAFSVVFFLLNVLLISLLSSIITFTKLMYNIFSNFKLVILNFFAMLPLGILAVVLYKISFLTFFLFVFPIIMAKFTFSLYVEAKTKYINTVDVIMRAMEARDKYTEGHSKRVAELACLIARELKYSERKIEDLNVASLLHDVGKIGIDDNILNKPGKLTEEEYGAIKEHPMIGDRILQDIKGINYVRTIVKYHHERVDGRGYPEGKTANDLSLDVFIVQLADSVDAMSADRPYRKAMNQEEIIEEIKKNTGTQFHPRVVEAYFRTLKKQNIQG